MKHIISNEQAETTAQKLSSFRVIQPDKRQLLRGIVAGAPENVTRSAQLNAYFAADNSELTTARAGWLNGARAYVGLAVIVVILLGSGTLWLGFSRLKPTNQSSNQFTPSQLQANGKIDNAVNTITQQTQNESTTILSTQPTTPNTSATDAQLQQMQGSINEKF